MNGLPELDRFDGLSVEWTAHRGTSGHLGGTLDTIEAARKAVEIASDKQAADVVLLDLRGLAAFADFFIICSADSPRQITAIANALDDDLRREAVRLHHREGTDQSGWVLMDFGDIIVHIFSREQRSVYDLESAWRKAPALLRIA